MDDFLRQKIKLEFQNFQHPTYEQVFDPFYPNMAMIDLLFNEGERSLKIIKKGNDNIGDISDVIISDAQGVTLFCENINYRGEVS